MRRRGSVRMAPGHGPPVGQRHAQAAAVVRVRRHRLAIALPAGRTLAHVRQTRPVNTSTDVFHKRSNRRLEVRG